MVLRLQRAEGVTGSGTLGVWNTGKRQAQSSRAVALVLLGLVTTASAAGAAGRELYQRWCARCHGDEGGGGGRDASLFAEPPPALVGTLVLARYGESDLVAWVRQGKRLELGMRPEVLREHAERTEALYRYLRRLPSVRWHEADAGRELYATRCLPCHDDYGRPQEDLPPGVQRSPRDLSDATLQRSTEDDELVIRVRHGRAGMPALVPPVEESEARELVAFVRLLSPGYEVYDRFCQACHGIHGEGAPDAPAGSGLPTFAFDERYFGRRSADWTLDRVWHMLRDAKAAMPHFGTSLGEADVREILRYLRTIEP